MEETKICKQHFLITRRVYKNFNFNLKFILILSVVGFTVLWTNIKENLFLVISVLSVDVNMTYCFINIRFATAFFC